MPLLVLKPHMEMVITFKQERAIQKFLASEEVAMVVNKTTITKSSVAYIKPGGLTSADLPVSTAPRLKADSRSDEEKHKAARKASEVARENLRKKGLRV